MGHWFYHCVSTISCIDYIAEKSILNDFISRKAVYVIRVNSTILDHNTAVFNARLTPFRKFCEFSSFSPWPQVNNNAPPRDI